MSSFIEAYKRTGNSIIAYKQVVNCDDKSLQDIVKGSFSSLEQVFEEVDFYVSTETKRGILKNTSKILGGIVSLGGSYMLELHNKHYSDINEAIYKPACNIIESIERETNECLSLIGEQLTEVNKILKPVGSILDSRISSEPAIRHSVTRINKFKTGFNTSLNAGFGGLVGGSTALGAWGLVSLIGSASTGTAISSLSGVAATNATLAWFGGGSLATGGAGMVGGFWVLGGIVAAPIVFFSTKSAYKKVDTIKEKKNKLTEESGKLIKLTQQALIHLIEARVQQTKITTLIAEYAPKIQDELKLYKFHRSFWKDLLGYKMNAEQEEHYNNLNKLASELLDKLGIK
ncbi:hypothetical protein L2745_14670 [Shewanella xiamenensis]|uniref:hypothetical protein n=1 Tax=Shewanella xiamenensis TaxID=332186 RepID=UPI00166D951B|nr:hypothetical protein [Shewanella xiamenensis]MCL1071868.1 hypothetical protein [Shewanella xiamenensis]GGM98010.1 hypothetical protein GCM10009124_28730 [Shewanella xiamenensis]